MKRLVCLTILTSFIFVSCNSSLDPLGDENLSISTNKSVVTLTNTSDEFVYYILLEYETSTLIDLDPDAEWSVIEANSKVSIPYSEIMGYQESSDEAFIMWKTENRSSGNSQKFKF